MRLLFITQKVDRSDDVLGFVHRWIEELASHWEKVTVLCLYEGEHHLPANVEVLSLGKEKGAFRAKYLFRFYLCVFKKWFSYDRVFVHMNPEYLVLAGALWRLGDKKVALWYSHKSNNLKLRIAVLFANVIFTTVSQSITFKSKKVQYVGHGIDVAQYRCFYRTSNDTPILLSVGRITRIKQCETLIEAAAILREQYQFKTEIVFAGKPVHEDDRLYEKELQKQVSDLGITNVRFTGSISLEELKEWYCKADIVVNMVPTGGLDKAVLEGMAAGAITLSSNEAFRKYLGRYADRLSFRSLDAPDLASKIRDVLESSDREEVRTFLNTQSDQFDVSVLIGKLSEQIAA